MFLYSELLEIFPKFKKFFWKNLYQYLGTYKYPEWTFMNYGFDSQTEVPLLKQDEADRYCIQLYDKVVASQSLKDKKLLEVGCGRGGGLSYINRYYKPAVAFGIDLSATAIDFCRETHGRSIIFDVGDATNLSFSSESMDVIINVESSHCYPDLSKFFQEVYRVLKHDGVFLYADLCVASHKDEIEAKLQTAGFAIVEQESIVQGVLNALKLDNDRKQSMIKKNVPFFIRWPFIHFAGMVGSRPYRSFVNGTRQYNRYVLKKIGTNVAY